MKFPLYENLLHETSPYLQVYPGIPGGDFDIYRNAPIEDFCRSVFGVRGKIWPSEAMTLCELAYFCGGPVLELGTFQGASTVAMCKANSDVTTIDISPVAIDVARNNFLRLGVNPRIIQADAAEGMKLLVSEERKFTFLFMDHDHAYDAVYRACVEIPRLMIPNSLLFFHDFQDSRNETGAFGVYLAVKNVLEDKLDFVGLSGNGVIFRYIGT